MLHNEWDIEPKSIGKHNQININLHPAFFCTMNESDIESK